MIDGPRESSASSVAPPHPLAKDLVAYHAGELSESESEKICEHLCACPECTRVVLGLSGRYRELRAPWAWSALKGKLEEKEGWPSRPSAEGVESGPRGSLSRRPRFALAAALAALSLAAALLFGLHLRLRGAESRAADLEGRLGTFEESRVLGSAIDLLPRGSLRDLSVDRPVLRVEPGDELLLIRLILMEDPASNRLEIDIVDASEETLGVVRAVSVDEERILNLVLPRRSIPAGTYRFKLRTEGRPVSEVPADYVLTIEYE